MNNSGLRSSFISALVVNLCLAGSEIPSGTKIPCRLEQSISSATAEENQPVTLSVTEDIKVDGKLVFAQGAQVVGSVITATAKRRMGRTGKLDFSIDKARAVDGEFVPLRYTPNKKEGGSHAVSTGVMTAGAAVLFWPAAPFFLLRKGKDVTINKGIVLEVFTDQDHALKQQASTPATLPLAPIAAIPPQAVAAVATPVSVPVPVPVPVPVAVSPGKLSITSDPTAAEISIDGKYIGSTPAQGSYREGEHTVKVTKRGFVVWERRLTVRNGDSINVNAELEKEDSNSKIMILRGR